MVGVGVDPGPSFGALAFIEAHGSCMTWAWSLRRAGTYRATWRVDGVVTHEAVVAGLAALRTGIRVHAGAQCAVEAVHVGRVRGAQLVALAEDAGAWVGWLGVHGIVQRPVAATWRREVLGLSPRTAADDCDRAAIAAVLGQPCPGRRQVVTLGLRWGGPPPSPHEADALCIAAWAAGVRA